MAATEHGLIEPSSASSGSSGSLDGAKRNPGSVPDCAPLHPGYRTEQAQPAGTGSTAQRGLLDRCRAVLLAFAERRRGKRGLPATAATAAAHLAGLLGAAVAPTAAHAMELPEDRADLIFHGYDGGGVRALGPALLVRKSIANRLSVSALYYVDSVSNASIDVVTTASPFKERRSEYGLGVDYLVRDSKITVAASNSDEPDYVSKSASVDVAQEVFGGMTTVNLGFTRVWDEVGQRDVGFFDNANHWRYRLGVSQVLTPRWVAGVNAEVVSDEGFLGSPYRAARVFGAAVPERNPRTRSSRAVSVSAIGAIGSRSSIRADYRYFWDTWDIRAHTTELRHSRYFGDRWLADGYVRFYSQSKALFYSDNATAETTYISRNRQLSTFRSLGLGVKGSYTYAQVEGKYTIKLHGAYERLRFSFSDFTDVRTGQAYKHDANVFQFFVTANY